MHDFFEFKTTLVCLSQDIMGATSYCIRNKTSYSYITLEFKYIDLQWSTATLISHELQINTCWFIVIVTQSFQYLAIALQHMCWIAVII